MNYSISQHIWGTVVFSIVAIYLIRSGQKMQRGGEENLYFYDKYLLWINRNRQEDEIRSLKQYLINPERVKRQGRQGIIWGSIILIILSVSWIIVVFN